jgi:preprotein translocase subunit SecY
MLYIVVALVILLVQGTRRIPVQFAKKIVGNKQYGGVRQYIPLKVNASGVMPIIFAQAIMFIPTTIAQFFPESNAMQGVAGTFSDYFSFWYNLVFATLIILFTYFYTAISVNPNQMAEDMKKNGGFIPGVKPGRSTADFIDNVMSKITLPGSLFLAIVAIMPTFANMAGNQQQFRTILRRYIAPHPRWCGARYAAANRKPPSDETLRRPDEIGTYQGSFIGWRYGLIS